MPATLRIDTLKFARKLTEAGMEPRMAEAIVDGLADADMPDLATKADTAAIATDLVALRAAAKADTAALATDLVALRAATKADLAELKAEMFRFMLVQSIGIVGLTVTLIKLLP